MGDDRDPPIPTSSDDELEYLIQRSNHLIAEAQQLLDNAREMRERVDKVLAQSRRLRRRFRRVA